MMRGSVTRSPLFWVAAVVIAAGAGVLLWSTGVINVPSPRAALTAVALSATPTPTATATPLPSATFTPSPLPAIPTAAAKTTITAQPTADLSAVQAVTPQPGYRLYSLTPAPNAVGWVSDGDKSANHFGDYNIYAGVYDGRQHIGAVQFSLDELPPGAPIAYADVVLVGVADEWLGSGGAWQADLLQAWMDPDWPERTFADLSAADAAELALTPPLSGAELAAGRANVMVLGPEALAKLSERTLTGLVSFRIQGPSSGADNLFSWDSGYGTNTRGWMPVLRVVAGGAPETPLPAPTLQLVVITATPTAENRVTAALLFATATAQATTTGTPTPLPLNWVTPAVVIPTATPANAATAAWHLAEGTALAALYGTPTLLPPNAWTATPTPTPFAITNTPTPANPAVAIAQAVAEATQRATAGAPTPFPPNWVTVTPVPVTRVATATPPLEEGTAQAVRAYATIVALRVGTATPLPWRYVTPTPLPLLIPISRITPTAAPTGTPGTPAVLKGKILFLSDRLGDPRLFVMNPDGSGVALVTQAWPYSGAKLRDAVAPDGRRKAFVKPNERGVPQIYGSDPAYAATWAITTLSRMAYGPSWSPLGERIVFVGTEPGNDEIYSINADGSGLTRLTSNTWEWDKHPSWSPDGKHIVFYSNRITGRSQIWIMNADGSGQVNISNNEYAETDPVWIK